MKASDAETSVQLASADQPSQPQRSRATFVCKECKRLKLKCDRQQPCSQCLKRNAPLNCLYPAGAAEKLDLHNLNNRVVHLEAFTTTYTNGRFQPAYPSANHSLPAPIQTLTASRSNQQHPGWNFHQHHHHAGIPVDHHTMAETFSKCFQGLIPTCLGDLDIVQDPASSTRRKIKVEAPFVDERSNLPAPPSNPRTSKLQLRQDLRARRNKADTMLPSPSVYFSTTPQNSVPQMTSALLSCLPPLPTCQRLLRSAGEVFRVRPLPFNPMYGSAYGWLALENICLQFLSNVGTEREVSSLTFFGMTCAALAIGAVSILSEGDGALVPSSAAFFYALSQQALGTWDTYLSSSPSKRSATKDAEQIEYLFACLLSVVYLLQSGTIAAASADEVAEEDAMETAEKAEDGQDEHAELISSLVGKMVAAARKIRIDRETTWKKRKKKKSNFLENSGEEWKRMVWWEIVFYDLFIADALGQQPHIALTQFSTNFPACAIFLDHSTKSEGAKTVIEDDPHSTDQERGVQIAAPADLRRHTRITESRAGEAYFGARYQLARVARDVRSRNSLHSCCGYTLDQAVALENQVREWQDALPTFLKITADDETHATIASSIPDALHVDVESTVKRLHAYELAIVSNVLVVNVYMPFLHAEGEDGVKCRFQNLPAAIACIHAAQAIVHLADGLQSLLSKPSMSNFKVMPVMFGFIPLEKLVFGAAVVCTHAAFAVKSPSMTFITRTIADDASLGLRVLRGLRPPLLTSFMEREGDDEIQNRVMDILHARLFQRSTCLKRNLDESRSAGDPQDVNQAVCTAPAVSQTLAYHPLQISQEPPTQHTFILDSFSSPGSDQFGSQSLSNAKRSSRSNTGQQSLNKIKGKKEKKEAKAPPAVGVRRRQPNSRYPAPRPLPNFAESTKLEVDAWNLEVQMNQDPTTFSPSRDVQTMQAMSPIATSVGSFTGLSHRSRSSSSTSHIHLPTSSHFRTPLTQPPDNMPPRKRPVLQDIREHLQPQLFVSHTFDQGPHQAQQDHFMPTTFEGQGPAYRVGPVTQSPYLNPITASEHTYAPQPVLAQQTTYFASPSSYGSAFAGHSPSSNVMDPHTPISGDTAATVMDSQSMMSVSTTPVFDRSSQQLNETYPSQAQNQHQMHNHSMPANPYHDQQFFGQPQPSAAMYDSLPPQEYGGGSSYNYYERFTTD